MVIDTTASGLSSPNSLSVASVISNAYEPATVTSFEKRLTIEVKLSAFAYLSIGVVIRYEPMMPNQYLRDY